MIRIDLADTTASDFNTTLYNDANASRKFGSEVKSVRSKAISLFLHVLDGCNRYRNNIYHSPRLSDFNAVSAYRMYNS